MNKIVSMLGLCRKAGKLAYGSDMCEEKIKYHKISLLIVTEDASENTKERFKKLAQKNQIKLYIYGTMENLSRCIGKDNKVVYGIMDQNFAEKINKLFEESKGANC